MGGKKKYINIFGSFTELFSCLLVPRRLCKFYFGPDWPLLFKVHEIRSVDSQENY